MQLLTSGLVPFIGLHGEIPFPAVHPLGLSEWCKGRGRVRLEYGEIFSILKERLLPREDTERLWTK